MAAIFGQRTKVGRQRGGLRNKCCRFGCYCFRVRRDSDAVSRHSSFTLSTTRFCHRTDSASLLHLVCIAFRRWSWVSNLCCCDSCSLAVRGHHLQSQSDYRFKTGCFPSSMGLCAKPYLGGTDCQPAVLAAALVIS